MTDSLSPSSKSGERTLDDLVFAGFNSQVLALDRYSGEVVWDWKAPKGRASVPHSSTATKKMASMIFAIRAA